MADTITTYWRKLGNMPVRTGYLSIARKYVTVNVFIAAKIKAKYVAQPILK
jgi:hypothetical protein